MPFGHRANGVAFANIFATATRQPISSWAFGTTMDVNNTSDQKSCPPIGQFPGHGQASRVRQNQGLHSSPIQPTTGKNHAGAAWILTRIKKDRPTERGNWPLGITGKGAGGIRDKLAKLGAIEKTADYVPNKFSARYKWTRKNVPHECTIE